MQVDISFAEGIRIDCARPFPFPPFSCRPQDRDFLFHQKVIGFIHLLHPPDLFRPVRSQSVRMIPPHQAAVLLPDLRFILALHHIQYLHRFFQIHASSHLISSAAVFRQIRTASSSAIMAIRSFSISFASLPRLLISHCSASRLSAA